MTSHAFCWCKIASKRCDQRNLSVELNRILSHVNVKWLFLIKNKNVSKGKGNNFCFVSYFTSNIIVLVLTPCNLPFHHPIFTLYFSLFEENKYITYNLACQQIIDIPNQIFKRKVNIGCFLKKASQFSGSVEYTIAYLKILWIPISPT